MVKTVPLEESPKWTKGELSLLRRLSPSLEKILGNVTMPPEGKLVEEFVDRLSIYGFHCFPLENWEGINNFGLACDVANYFIADRTVSLGPYWETKQRRETINIHEYFERFNNSVRLGDLWVSEAHHSLDTGLLVINRSKALHLDGIRLTKDDDEGIEYRNPGFLDYAKRPVLDEGQLMINGTHIPKGAIVGHFKLDGINTPIVQYYGLVVKDFVDNTIREGKQPLLPI